MAQTTHQQSNDKPAQQQVTKPTTDQALGAIPTADVSAASQARVDPRALTPRNVLALQHTIGNQQVARMVARTTAARTASAQRQAEPVNAGEPFATSEQEVLSGGGASPVLTGAGAPPNDVNSNVKRVGQGAIQAKLTVNAPGDQYEQEADKVAAQVMTMRDPAPVQRQGMLKEDLQAKSLVECVQRDHETEAPEDEVQEKPLVQRATEEDELQAKPLAQRKGDGGFETNNAFAARVQTSRGSGSPLPDETRDFMESRIGADFGDVRVHTGGEAAQLNREVQAQAFTHGQDIYFNDGKYNPNSSDGKQLLAHELTHTIQQGTTQSVKRTPVGLIQREWDLAAYETANASGYAALLAKMEGLTPSMGKSRLAKLVAKTDSPEQLNFLIQMGTRNLEVYLGSFDAATLSQLMTLIGKAEFFSVVNNLVNLKVDIKDYLANNPEAKLSDIKAQIASAKNTAGLISAKGTEIAFTTVAAVVGDGKKDEKAAVAAAVKALDEGTLVGAAHGNGEGNLPGVRGAGGYTEYDVAPPSGTTDRGPRRLVVHNAKNFVYYTWNHYGDPGGTNLPAFKRIR